MLTEKQKEALERIGAGVVCRITQPSRHFDSGCYVLPEGKHVNGHAVGWLIRKGYLEEVDCPEEKRPPHALYYKRKEGVA